MISIRECISMNNAKEVFPLQISLTNKTVFYGCFWSLMGIIGCSIKCIFIPGTVYSWIEIKENTHPRICPRENGLVWEGFICRKCSLCSWICTFHKIYFLKIYPVIMRWFIPRKPNVHSLTQHLEYIITLKRGIKLRKYPL